VPQATKAADKPHRRRHGCRSFFTRSAAIDVPRQFVESEKILTVCGVPILEVRLQTQNQNLPYLFRADVWMPANVLLGKQSGSRFASAMYPAVIGFSFVKCAC
jgi:hypothetical protein